MRLTLSEEVSMFISMIQKRRSIRKFSEKEIEAEKIDMLVEAALRALSSVAARLSLDLEGEAR